MYRIRELFNKLMSQPEWNSRFIFLVHGLASGIGVLVLTLGFLWSKDRSLYPDMILAVGGSGGMSAVGRYFTKKVGPTAAQPAVDSCEDK